MSWSWSSRARRRRSPEAIHSRCLSCYPAIYDSASPPRPEFMVVSRKGMSNWSVASRRQQTNVLMGPPGVGAAGDHPSAAG